MISSDERKAEEDRFRGRIRRAHLLLDNQRAALEHALREQMEQSRATIAQIAKAETRSAGH